MKDLIDILLSTYNGAKYVEVQILSIISQSYKNWHLIIHDDGSSDDTIYVIKKWMKIDERIKLVEDTVRTGSAAQNFMYLLKYSTAKYVMFCDQDDIWFDNKIQLMYDKMCQLQHDVAQIVYSDSYVWKPNSGIVGKATLAYPQDIKSFLFLNSGMQGCASMFNECAKKIMLQWSGSLAMHDHILHLIGLSMGNVSYIRIPLMLYRKHSSNVTGETKIHLLDFNSLHMFNKSPVVSVKHYDAIKQFVTLYKNVLDKNVLKLIDIYLQLPQVGLITRLIFVCRYKYKIYNSNIILLMKMLIKPYIG